MHKQLAEQESTISRLQCELHEAEQQRNLLASRISELNCDIQHQEKEYKQLTEQQRAEQDEVQSTTYFGKTVSCKAPVE